MTGNGSGNRRPNATDLDAVRELYLTAEWVPCAMHAPAMADELEALRERLREMTECAVWHAYAASMAEGRLREAESAACMVSSCFSNDEMPLRLALSGATLEAAIKAMREVLAKDG